MKKGFTLAEMVVALVLFGAISGALFRALLSQQRLYRHQTRRAEGNATVRGVALILPSEFRELDAGDSLDGDILEMTASSIRYRASRNLGFLCRRPNVGARSVLLWSGTLGQRDLDPAVDSVLVFADGDITRPDDDRWLHADVLSVSGSASCPGVAPAPGLRVQLAGIAETSLTSVHPGAPVRGFELAEVRAYRGGEGMWWVGMRRYQKDRGRWPRIQPLLGPLAPGGLEFRYYRSNDRLAARPWDVTTIGILVSVPPLNPQSGPPVEVRVAMRNNPSR